MIHCWRIVWCLLGAAALAAEAAQEEAVSLPSIGVAFEPFVWLEHVNLNSGHEWSETLEAFWFEVLRFGRDPRAPAVLNLTNAARGSAAVGKLGGLRWANVGLQQAHLPFGDELEIGRHPSQTLRGEIVLAWPPAKIPALRNRLATHGYDVQKDDRFRGPFGNRFAVEAASTKFGPFVGDLKDASLPGGDTEGLGIRALRFDVGPSTASSICAFYDVFFRAATETSSSEGGQGRCVVRVGHSQSLEFHESPEGHTTPYDGHHVALYVNGPAFVETYERLDQSNLVYFNPRFPQFRYDTLDDALRFNEFRLLDIIDPHSGRHVYQLEHEIRNLRHHGFDPLRHRLQLQQQEEEPPDLRTDL